MARGNIVRNYNEYHNAETSTIAGTKLMSIDGHGEIITPGDDIAEVTRKAGLGFSVMEAAPLYTDSKGQLQQVPNRKILYRSDTGAALSMVSANKYKVRQPADILATFRELLSTGGFNIEAAGSIQGGKKLWAYARRPDDGADILGDMIAPGLLVMESFDGTIATSCRFETLRIVCNNVLSMSRCQSASAVTKRHSQEWNITEVMAHLSDFDQSFKVYMEHMRALTQVRMTDNLRRKFFAKIYAPEALTNPNVAWHRSGLDLDRVDAKGKALVSTNAKNVLIELEAVAKDSPGANLPTADGTVFGALQAVTYYQDHAARSKGEKRFESATVGQGKRRKDEAYRLALELA